MAQLKSIKKICVEDNSNEKQQGNNSLKEEEKAAGKNT